MINSKDRATLRGIANTLCASFNVGKGGLSENMLSDILDALNANELVKINVLKSADVNAKDVANEIASAIEADVVSVLGNKIVLYRVSVKDGVKHLLDL